MERRHQVFVSSTFKDLEEERQEIIYALLELDCMPAGMELFPATDGPAWDLIKSVIDDSDYYALVIGGRYGSTDAAGIGFTEKEYDYAVLSKKPVMAFLHAQPELLSAKKTETTDAGKAKLAAFKAKVEQANHVKYWSSPAELGGFMSRSLVQLRRHYPSDGWVPGRYALTELTIIEQEKLRARVKELESELLLANRNTSTYNVDDLASGDDIVAVRFFYFDKSHKAGEPPKECVGKVTWNTILKYVGPSLIPECDTEALEMRIKLAYWHAVEKTLQDTMTFEKIVLTHVDLDRIKVQLRALGYLASGIKRRAVADKKTYWALTSLGESTLMQITAQKKKKPAIAPEIPTPAPAEKVVATKKAKAR